VISEEDLLDIADHATRSLIKRVLIGARISDAEADDMRQAAVLKLRLYGQKHDLNIGMRPLLFVIAKHAAFEWIYWWQHNIRNSAYFCGNRMANSEQRKSIQVISLDGIEDSGYQLAAEIPDLATEPLPKEVNDQLYKILCDERKKKGMRGTMAAVRDIRIINYVVMGYNNTAIDNELNSSGRDISHYRRSIQKRLSNHLNKRVRS